MFYRGVFQAQMDNSQKRTFSKCKGVALYMKDDKEIDNITLLLIIIIGVLIAIDIHLLSALLLSTPIL